MGTRERRDRRVRETDGWRDVGMYLSVLVLYELRFKYYRLIVLNSF